MRAARALVFILLAVATEAGCATPAYYMRSEDLGAAVAPAIRAGDGAKVWLRGGSYRAAGEPARSDGRVVVRGVGVHGARFKAGAAVLGIGLAMAGGGAAIALTNFEVGCWGGEYCAQPPRSSANGGAFAFGFAISILGDAMAAAMGPALMISGARQPPEELR